MNEKILCAPIRLIAFHSGKYEFAEVRLDAPLHLMGANNVGKTSLIAMLQFLYLDNQKYMHFSHSLPETRRYYFPHNNSYILFECRTPDGMGVIGVHGLGAARQYEFERFFFRGRFDAADFITQERRMRDVDDVKARLAAKGFVKLEGRHLQAALSGVGDDRGVRLGLVPLRDRGQYKRFRFLFCNLLRLAQLRQDELKNLLVEIYSSEFQQKKINLAVDYRERFLRLQRDTRSVHELRWIEKDVQRLFEIVSNRDQARGILPVVWKKLGSFFMTRDAELAQIERETVRQRDELAEQEKQLQAVRTELSCKRDDTISELGGIRTRITVFEETQNELSDFMPDWAEQRHREVERERGELQTRINSLEGDAPERIEKRIERLVQELEDAVRLRDSAEHLSLTKLRGELSDDEISEIFRLLNPALLEVHDDNISRIDTNRLCSQLTELRRRLDGDSYNDDSILIDIGQIPPIDISSLLDPEIISIRIKELSRTLERERKLLETARDRAAFTELLEKLRVEEHELSGKLFKWRELEQKRPQYRDWQERVRQLEDAASDLQNKLTEIAQQIREIEKRVQALDDEAAIAARDRRDLLEKQRRLTAPPKEWQPADNVNVPETFDDLYETYLRGSEDERRFADDAEKLMITIHERTYEKYAAPTEAKTMKLLRSAVEALGNREAALRKSWADLAVGLRSSFAALSHDLERLQGKVADLNRRIGKVTVSNLSAVRLIVSERAEWMKRIHSLCELQDDLPLFGGGAGNSREMEELGRLLEQSQTVELRDLFDLQFEIKGTDGKERRYPNLDKIESNGTTITIKVLVHLILLRDLMSSGQAIMPFYLDEVSSLDHDNITGIIQQAGTLDFIPVLASPDPVEEVDRIYMLAESENGHIVLDDSALIELQRKKDNEDG